VSILPIQINIENEFPEETRLKYRYLDLRRARMHNNVVLRSKVISHMRQVMNEMGFLEIQTPILTSSSPEGARDYVVPSRIHHGHFYALPQAPQQFKQLLMVSGFDRYFQVAPCFRDEDARADRSSGEFYQLDLEMSFASQDDIFVVVENLMRSIFSKFKSDDFHMSPEPFRKITYRDSMLHYGTDKPDLRIPLIIEDVTEVFAESNFTAFKGATKEGALVRSINVPRGTSNTRSFFDKVNGWAQEFGIPGIGYISISEEGEYKGPIAKFLKEEELKKIAEINNSKSGDAIFLICDKNASSISGKLRVKLGKELGLIDQNSYAFCWVVDFPMYELDEETGKIVFSHNPFSMPQGGLEALISQDPLDIMAFQYDIVCNGIELSSGAIRNHVPEVMYKAFEIAGYDRSEVDSKFRAMVEAFKFGAPPHGGCAPGIDRILMLLSGSENIREVIAFPFNQQAQDLMMGAPADIEPSRLKELGISLIPKKPVNS
jgi:aspartyl-tRNA synthetase